MQPAPPTYAWYGDDFTGASDTLATLSEAGLKVRLFLDVPTPAQLREAGRLDAVGIAGATRAMKPADMRAALLPVADFFSKCEARILHYKCCSTFDSAPHVGSIGEAVRVLAAAVGNPPVLIIGGQPSLGRYCIFGELFATAGTGGAVHRIDRHPTMSVHPVTPMTEANLARHLAKQGLETVQILDVRMQDQADGELAAAVEALLSSQRQHGVKTLLLDVLNDAHLRNIGKLIAERSKTSVQLCVGASSVAQSLLPGWNPPLERPENMQGRQVGMAAANGPVLVLAGSMSPLTSVQIARAESYQRISLDPGRVASQDAGYADSKTEEITALLRKGRNVLAHTSPLSREDAGGGITADLAAALAPASARLLRRVLETAPVARLGVAGGDTSSYALKTLGPTSLEWIGRPAPGVALCRAHAAADWLDGMEIMLKGGQMGGEDLFELLAHGTKTNAG